MHLRDENLERYVLGRLSPSQSTRTQSHLLECEACQSRLQKTVAAVGPSWERRREDRSVVDAPASRQALDPSSPVPSDIRVVDVSKTGLKMRVPERMEPGTRIQIRVKKTIASGEVRYCHPDGDGFYIGVQFERVSSVKRR